MTTYNSEELQRLIKQYGDDLLKRYSVPEKSFESAVIDKPEASQAKTMPGDETDVGFLQVRVSTENQAVPLVGAIVTVTRDMGNDLSIVRTMTTDESGLTSLIDLPAKERALSLSPGNEQPFSVYSINVFADGYFPKRFTNLPVYGGVTAIQSVSMIPLPEGGSDDTVLIYPQSAPSIT